MSSDCKIQFIFGLIPMLYSFVPEIRMDSSGHPSGYEQDDEGDDKELDPEPIVIPVRESRYRYSWSLQADEGFDDLDGRTMGYCTASCNYILADLWGRLWTIIGVLVWK